MKQTRSRFAGGIVLAVALALNVGVRAAEPSGPISGDYEVTVGTDATETWNGVVSGDGRIVKKGNGTLVLTAANTFTGGIRIEAGYVQIDHLDASGTGKITLVPAAATLSNRCQFKINATGTYTNDIEQLADGYVAYTGNVNLDCANLFVTYAASPVTFTGRITSTGDFRYHGERKPGDGGSSGPGPSVTFNGDVYLPGKTLFLATYGSPVFNGKVTCSEIRHLDAWSSGGTVTFGNSGNEIGAILNRNNSIKATEDGAFGGARIDLNEGWNDGTTHGNVNLNGTTQRVMSLYDHGTQSIGPSESASCRSVNSSSDARLVLTGESTSRSARQSIQGNVTVVVDAAGYPGFVQTLNDRTNQTSGDLIASNGTLRITGAATFANVPKIVVGPNGTFDIQSTAETAFAGARQLVVDGTLVTTRSDTFPNDGSLILAVSSSAHLTLPSDYELQVYSFTVDGVPMAPGTYEGAAYGLASGKVKLQGVPTSGDYVINVPAGKTNVVEDVLTGSIRVVKEGAGALRLANAANDFTGGVVVNNGDLLVSGTNTLGTGKIVVNSTGTSTVQLHFVGDANRLDNDIELNGSANEAYPSFFFNQDIDETVLTGTVACNGNVFFRHDRYYSSAYPTPGPTTVFEGPVVATNKEIWVRVYGEMHFRNQVVANLFRGSDAYSAGGTVLFYSDQNAIKTMQTYSFFLYCMADNVFSNSFGQISTAGWTGGGSRINMNGTAQTVKSLNSPNTTFSTLVGVTVGNHFHSIYSDAVAPSTLTIDGEVLGNSRETFANIYDNVNLVVDTWSNDDFVQAFIGRSSPMTGTIEVKRGGLELRNGAFFTGTPSVTVGENGTFTCRNNVDSPALPAVRTLVVNGLFDASTAAANPFRGSVLDSVVIGPNGVLKLPAGTDLQTKLLTVNGTTYEHAVITPEVSGGWLFGGSVVAQNGQVTEASWTGATDDALSHGGNWNPTTADVTLGTLKATFASSGSAATVDADAVLQSVDFTSANGFELLRNPANPHVLSVLGDIAAKGTGTPTYRIDNPMYFFGTERTVSAAEGNHLVFRNAFTTDYSLPGKLIVTGAGAASGTRGDVTFEGTNYIAGALSMTTNKVVFKGLIATPGHIDQGAAAEDGSKTITVKHNNSASSSLVLYGLSLANAVVEKPVCIRNKIGMSAIQSAANTTNELRGEVRFCSGAWQPILIESKSELTFSGGLFTDHSFRSRGAGTVRIVNKPVVGHASACYNPCSGRHVFEVSSNALDRITIGYNNPQDSPTVDFMVPNVLTNGELLVGINGGDYTHPSTSSKATLGNGPFTLDVHANDQLCTRLAVSSVGKVTGEAPAVITVTRGRADGEDAGYAVCGKVEGGVGFHMCGPAGNVLEFKDQAFDSTGSLKVSSGTLQLSTGASWLNGTNVTVCGTGILKMAGGALSRKTALALADQGRLDIPTGTQLAVRCATYGDAPIPGGVYSTGSLNGAVTGGGSLFVSGGGTMLLFR